MRLIIIGALAPLAIACATTYQPPTSTPPTTSARLNASRIEILTVAKRVLVSEGYQIASADDSAGVVSTALRNHRLTPVQADCGKTMGLDYLKDNRTTTRVGFGVIADEQRITVRVTIEGEYRPGDVSQDITLTCVSHGYLEDEILSKIVAGVRRQ